MLAVGSKFKRKIEKERKVGRGIQAIANKCIQSLEKHITEEWVAIFLFFIHFPASAFLFVSLEPDFDGDLRAAADSEWLGRSYKLHL